MQNQPTQGTFKKVEQQQGKSNVAGSYLAKQVLDSANLNHLKDELAWIKICENIIYLQ